MTQIKSDPLLLQSRRAGARPRLNIATGLALVFALGGAPAALAQTPPSPAADADKANIVVVTGTATPVEYEKIGNTLTVVSGDLIEDQGYNYVADVLRQVPGVAVGRTGPLGGITQVRIRGAEANHTLTLLDGIDITAPDGGEADYSTLMSGDLKRIEVLRGPQSGLYGSNALAGVVNLITRQDVNGHYGYGSIEAGEMNTLQVQAGGGIGDGDTHGSVGFNLLTTDGYDISLPTTPAGVEVPSFGVGGVLGDEEDNKIATTYVRGGKAFSDAFRVDSFLRYVHKDSGLDGQAFSGAFSGRTYDDASRTMSDLYLGAGSATLNLLDGKWISKATLSYQRDERRGFGPSGFAGVPNNTAPLNPNGSDATRSKAMVQSTYEFGNPGFVSYVTGFVEDKHETFKNACESPTNCGAAQRLKQTRDLLGVGGEYRAEIADQVYLSAALRRDFNSDFDDDTTYGVAGSWVVPNIGTRPHASYGAGITNPTFSEQFGFNPSTFVGNPNLIPEEARGYDIGVEQTLLDGNLVVDLTYFNSTLKNEIAGTFDLITFISGVTNSTFDSDRSGFEGTVRYTPIDGLDLIGSYTTLDATEANVTTGVTLKEIRRPTSQGALDATWKLDQMPLQLNLGVTYTGKSYDTGARTEQSPHTEIRAGASWQYDDELEFYARVENLTDEYYEEVIGFGSQPRAIFVGVRLKTEAN